MYLLLPALCQITVFVRTISFFKSLVNNEKASSFPELDFSLKRRARKHECRGTPLSYDRSLGECTRKFTPPNDVIFCHARVTDTRKLFISEREGGGGGGGGRDRDRDRERERQTDRQTDTDRQR